MFVNETYAGTVISAVTNHNDEAHELP